MKSRNDLKRNLFDELIEGVDSMAAHREGKITLRTHTVSSAPVEHTPGAEYFVAVRERFNVSRAVWAQMLHVSPRTVEKWEQGGQASPLAATFVDLVAKYPDTIERLKTLSPRSRGRLAMKSEKSATTASVSSRGKARRAVTKAI